MKNKAGAPIGNENRIKLKDPNLRQQAYGQFCSHLSKGKSVRSFVFIHPEFSVTGQTIDRMVREEPIEFPPIKREIAEAQGFGTWEQIVEEAATGKNPKANVPALQMAMRNKFGWDSKKDAKEEVDLAKLSALTEFFKSFPKNPQPK